MAKHEIVNEIIDYLERRAEEYREALSDETHSQWDISFFEGSLETYEHLITKLEDDFR
jgi:hypothetical protein